jgi:hypothetical protein
MVALALNVLKPLPPDRAWRAGIAQGTAEVGFRLCARGAQQQAAQQEAGEKNRDLAVPLGLHVTDYKAIFRASQPPPGQRAGNQGKVKGESDRLESAFTFLAPLLLFYLSARPSSATPVG